MAKKNEAAPQSFEERHAAYSAAEREIAQEHQATLAELTRRKVAAEEHRDARVVELEQRKADEHRLAHLAVNTKAHDGLAPLFSNLFDQATNKGILELVEEIQRANALAQDLLDREFSAQRFVLIALDVFRARRPGIIRPALEDEFWRYVLSDDVLRCGTTLKKFAESGNLAGARGAFDKLEVALFSLSNGEPTPEEIERWQAKIDPDPTVGERFEVARAAKIKADELEANRLRSEAWMRKQAADRTGRLGSADRVAGGHNPPGASVTFVNS